jgi:hypothetical protein
MIGEYEAGNAPFCDRCHARIECDDSLIGCEALRRGNELLGIAWQTAALISRIHDEKKRHYMAEANADAWPDVLPADWFDRKDFLAACGCREKVAA